MPDQFNSMPYEKPGDNCIAFVRINVTDLPRARKFYETVFGWVFMSEAYNEKIHVFKTGGQVMGSLHVRSDDGGDSAKESPAVLSYIKVADVEEALEKAVEAGGKLVTEKWNEGGHTDMGEFEDTEGNRWGLLKWLM